MKTLNVMLSNLGGRVVPIGYEGENLYTRVRINCIEVFADYPDATVSMVVNPPDGNMYPAIIEKSGVMVIWDITDAVLSSNGSGECQLTFTDGDVVRKSVVFGISINRSLIASGDPPEPVQEWIDKAEQTAQEIAENAANLAKEDIVESYGSIAPAIIETASGAIASFSDGADGMLVKTLTVDIDPVQDLHGYDNPWPGGGGKNLYNKDGTDTANGYVNGKILKSDGSENTPGSPVQWEISEYIEVSPSTSYVISGQTNLASSGTVYLCEYDSSKNFIKSTDDSFASVTFTTDQNTKYVRLTCKKESNATRQLEQGSTATAYAKYSNICPISGRTSADVTRTGGNVYTTVNSVDGKFIAADGTISANADFLYTDLIPVGDSTEVYAKSTNPGNTARYTRVHGYNASGTWVQQIDATQIQVNSTKLYSFEIPTGIKFIRISIAKSLTNVSFDMGNIYTYTFPESAGTVYGAELTINQDGTGALVADRVSVSYTEGWTMANGVLLIDESNVPIGCHAYKCNMYECDPTFEATGSTSAKGKPKKIVQQQFTAAPQHTRWLVYDTTFSSADDFNAYIANNPIQIVYEPAEPVPYNLTAQQVVSLLKGVNNVWADCGDVALEYPADTKLYIDARVAELQALILENISNS